MTIYAYKLRRIFLNGWVDTKTMLDSIGDIDEGDEYIDSWRELLAKRLDTVSALFTDMGWTDTGIIGAVWFAPLPVVDGPYTESEFMVAVDSDEATFIASPFELPWLAAKALDFRRDEMLAEPPSKARQ